MYITYETVQCSEVSNMYLFQYREPPEKFSTTPRPDFMPSKLIRIDDMAIVPGATVHEGYYALSYSWNQSGDMVKNATTGKMERADRGLHKIIREDGSEEHVKFEGLIQQICKDFNIHYLWYDQMCIDQSNQQEKHREIHHMHRIYSNACCTVALIPEFKAKIHPYPILCKGGLLLSYGIVDDATISQSQWFRRLWTLEEAIKSSTILFVGCNIHVFSYRIKERYIHLEYICDDFRQQQQQQQDIRTVLWNAHIRSCTHDHDRVFALANIFPDILNKIFIDYNQAPLDLMIEFYGHLARKDISILCFGGHTEYKHIGKENQSLASTSYNATNDNDSLYTVPIQKYNLPSWTGVDGEHITGRFLPTTLPYKNYSIDGISLKVTCTSITNNQSNIAHGQFTLEYNDIPPPPTGKTQRPYYINRMYAPHGNEECYDEEGVDLLVLVRLAGQINDRILYIHRHHYSSSQLDLHEHYSQIIKRLTILSHFVLIKKGSFAWWNVEEITDLNYYNLGFFNLTEENNEFINQYVLLFGMSFIGDEDSNKNNTYYPIIKREGSHYKAIGVYRKAPIGKDIFSPEDSDVMPEEHSFVIQ